MFFWEDVIYSFYSFFKNILDLNAYAISEEE